MSRVFFVLLIAALVVMAASGCGGSPPADSYGTVPERYGKRSTLSQQWDAHIETWKRELLASATSDAEVVFPTPPQDVLEKRLASAASEFDFRVLGVEFVPAPQGSPVVIVESSDPQLFSKDTPAIYHLVDPQKTGGEDWNGWDYEGFFLGAQDEEGAPFLAVYNFERAHGGGQWARSEELYPFPHG